MVVVQCCADGCADGCGKRVVGVEVKVCVAWRKRLYRSGRNATCVVPHALCGTCERSVHAESTLRVVRAERVDVVGGATLGRLELGTLAACSGCSPIINTACLSDNVPCQALAKVLPALECDGNQNDSEEDGDNPRRDELSARELVVPLPLDGEEADDLEDNVCRLEGRKGEKEVDGRVGLLPHGQHANDGVGNDEEDGADVECKLRVVCLERKRRVLSNENDCKRKVQLEQGHKNQIRPVQRTHPRVCAHLFVHRPPKLRVHLVSQYIRDTHTQKQHQKLRNQEPVRHIPHKLHKR